MDYLLEIGTEEIPARFVDGLIADLTKQLENVLNANAITFSKTRSFATYRRLTVAVLDIAQQQTDIAAEYKGPPEKIAYNADKTLTQAGLGFLKKYGTTESFCKDGYIYTSTFQKGKPTQEVLGDFVLQAIRKVYLPVAMNWGDEEEKFIRPVHWILSILGRTIIKFDFAGQTADNKTYGHLILSGSNSLNGTQITISSPDEYEEALLKALVIADTEKRKAQIVKQIKELNPDNPIPENLLAEVTHLVEYPTLVHGTFPESFLEVPEKILITTMQKNQKYFPVFKNGKLSNTFLIVADNVTTESKENIIKGNQRVVNARLCDAKFYFEEDTKHDFEHFTHKLSTVTFQQKLGTMAQKTQRNLKNINGLFQLLQLSPTEQEETLSIVKLMKADLATNMVFEFTDLQGYVGQQYALKWGYPKNIAEGIYQHYLPTYAGDSLPSKLPYSLASIADKIDTIVAHFCIGNIPTGSNDPFALRRQANGIVQILMSDDNLAINISDLLQNARKIIEESVEISSETHNSLTGFFLQRVEGYLKDKLLAHDQIKAINTLDISLLNKRLQFVATLSKHADFKVIVEAAVRISNITKNFTQDALVDEKLLELEVEHSVFDSFEKISPRINCQWDNNFCSELSSFAQLISRYFDEVMVMAENKAVQNNRLGFLKLIDNFFKMMADFKQFVI